MPKFKIRHLTHYRYDEPVRDSANQIILYPIKDAFQDVLEQAIHISGEPAVELHRDFYGNEVGIFTHTRPHEELMIDSRVVVTTSPRALPDGNMNADAWKKLAELKEQAEFFDFLHLETFRSRAEIEKLIESRPARGQSPLATVQDFASYIYQSFTYKKGITTVETTVDEIWKLKSGVCQDFAHTLLVMLRVAGVPARYVSGYICPDKKEMRGEGATHAWVEAYIPDYGWLGVDPTNNCIVNDSHVRLAVGRSFTDCSPVKGTYRGMSEHTLQVTVSVSYEDGHTSKDSTEVVSPDVLYPRNSYRRHVEMMQQQ